MTTTASPAYPTAVGGRDAIRSFQDLQAEVLRENGARVRTRFLGAGTDRPVHVLEGGTGAPLVMLHGGGGQAMDLAGLVARLQSRFRCFAVDRPGHGLSYRIDYRRVPDFRRDAAEFVDRTFDLLGLERATLLGHSMGGFFGLAFALAHPERVERLVLVGAPAGIDRELPVPLRALSIPGLGPLLWNTVSRPTEAGMRDFYARLLVHHPDRLTPSQVPCGVAAYRIEGADVGWLSALRRFATAGGVDDRCYLRDELPRITAPTLFVWGSHDAFAPPSSGRAACEAMEDATFVEVEDAGHMAWIDAPDACADRITAWLAAAS